MKTTSTHTIEIDYPTSDGKPMGETDLHRQWMFRIIDRLAHFYEGQQVYVSGNLLIFYEEGHTGKHFSPDAFVVKNCPPGNRDSFKIWEEGRVPDFVLETTSKKTRREDTKTKPTLYAQLRIPEYVLYDPTGDWLKPRLKGYRLVRDAYVAVEPDDDGNLSSEQLGLTLRLEDGFLEMYDAATGKRLLDMKERLAEQAKKSRRQRQELQLFRREAKRARQREVEALQKAAVEAEARKALEEELTRLRAQQGRTHPS